MLVLIKQLIKAVAGTGCRRGKWWPRVSYAGYSFMDAGEIMEDTVRLLFTGLLVACACWLACYAARVAGTRARAAWRRRRAEAACRAEVARGLAEIERYLQDHATGTRPGDPPRSSGDDPGT
jgi:hypothetical protein